MPNVIAKMFDCSTPLTPETAQAIKAQGVSVIGRYLGAKTHGWSKCITPAEVQVHKDAGLMIFSFWEGDPTYAAYFTYAQGVKDATEAVLEAQALGQPTGSTICLTVDFDAQDADMEAIRTYLGGAYKVLHPAGYLMGVYGSKRVLDNTTADIYVQTTAWSAGEVSVRACILQHAPSTTIAGVDVDVDDVYSGPGWWNQPPAAPAPVPGTIAADVAADAWYADAAKFAIEQGFMSKDSNGNFNPDAPVTRAQLAQVVYNITHQKK